ncbi:hypothetical protein D018_0465A, partial [Vibrio parahaemolyticus VP2007-007]
MPLLSTKLASLCWNSGA